MFFSVRYFGNILHFRLVQEDATKIPRRGRIAEEQLAYTVPSSTSTRLKLFSIRRPGELNQRPIDRPDRVMKITFGRRRKASFNFSLVLKISHGRPGGQTPLKASRPGLIYGFEGSQALSLSSPHRSSLG